MPPHYPYRQFETARGVRKSPLHDRLQAAGACHGELAGWERPNWYAPPGVPARYEYSYGRQNWFDYSAAEHRAVRDNVGLFDQSSFAKFRLEGRDAARVLNRICTNDVDVRPGRIVYTQWLNERGGIEADLTVTRLTPDSFLIVTAAATEVRDFHWLKTHIPRGCALRTHQRDLGAGRDLPDGAEFPGTPSISDTGGPRQRSLPLRDQPGDRTGLWAGAGVAHHLCRRTRLGTLLYPPSSQSASTSRSWRPGRHLALRMPATTPWTRCASKRPTATGATTSPMKTHRSKRASHSPSSSTNPAASSAAEALLRQKETGICRSLVQFRLRDPGPLLYHNEPIWYRNEIAGYITSGNYGHTLGGSIGIGYVNTALVPEFPNPADEFEIEVAGERVPAEASLRPMYDPGNKRIRC